MTEARKINKGDRVLVLQATDDTCPPEFIGLVGFVTDFDTDGGCGNDKDHPLIEVDFRRRVYYEPDGIQKHKRYAYRYHFWREELRWLPR